MTAADFLVLMDAIYAGVAVIVFGLGFIGGLQ